MKEGPSYLEKMGIKVFDSFGDLHSSLGDQSRLLTTDEKQSLHKTQRNAVLKCAFAGALSALLSGVADVWAAHLFGSDLNYWLLFGGVTLVVSLIEILYLYRVSLAAVHSIARACDVSLIEKFRDNDEELVLSLVRAALEIESPKDSDLYINPLKHASRWKLIGFSIAYKLKVMASNLVAKILLRKVILRGATRAWLSFIAVPITGIWNAIVCYWITKEAMIRSLGPAYIEETLPTLLEDPNVHECSQRALACCIAATNDIHPNHFYMLQKMRAESGMIVKDEPESIAIFQQQMALLPAKAQQAVMDTLAISIMIDGKIKSSEMKLYQACAHTFKTATMTPSQHLDAAYRS